MASRRNRTQRKNKNRSRRNKQGGGAMTCSDAKAIMNGTMKGSKLFAGVKIRSECTKNASGRVTGNLNTSKSVAPNKRWYNERARKGEQGVWDEKVSPTGTRVVPVKSCGTAGMGENGTCANNSQAEYYNNKLLK